MITVAFAGPMGSGKSVVSERVAQVLGWPRVSFGNYVKSVAVSLGYDDSRETLQELGSRLIIEKGWEQFCTEVIAQNQSQMGEGLIIDGIRHSEAINTIRKIMAPSKVYLAHLTLNQRDRENRLLSRDFVNKESLLKFEEHSTEEQVKTLLPHLADVILSNSNTLNDVVEEAVAWIRHQISSS